MTQQIIVRPLGIITQPNKVGVFEAGALSAALRAYMRDPGLIQAADVWQRLGTLSQGGTSITYLVPVGRDRAVWLVRDNAAGQWFYAWVDTANGVLVPNSTLPLQVVNASNRYSISTAGQWFAFTMRSRTLVTCDKGVVVWDYESPTTTADAAPRNAGLIPCMQLCFVNVPTSAESAMDTGMHCHVVVVTRRKFADGYELFSAPSFVSQAKNNTGSTANISVQVQFPSLIGGFNAELAAGDVLEVYRTRAQASSVSGTGTNTGSDYYLSSTKTLTTSDLALSGITIVDSTPDSALGEALYTNQGLLGAAAMALPPPSAKTAAVFRGHAFIANLTNPAQFSLLTPAYWGPITSSTTAARASGIGSRFVSGTATNGSPTITGVSADDMRGIVVGQRAFSVSLAFSTAVLSRTASTITLSNPWTGASGPASLTIADTMTITTNGVSSEIYEMSQPSTFVQQNGWNSQQLVPLCIAANISTLYNPTGILPFSSPATPVIIRRRRLGGTAAGGGQTTNDNITVSATNGWNYLPRLPRTELGETATFTPTDVPNGLVWSEENQPENFPAPNYAFAGKGEIYALESTRDALWIFASDGLWRLSGTGGQVGAEGYDWRIDPVDSTLILSGPQASCVLRDTVYAYTNRGFVSIDSSGSINELSHGKLDDLLPGPDWSAPTWSAATAMYVVANPSSDEVWFRVPPIGAEPNNGRIWIYNVNTAAFTQDIPALASGANATSFHMAHTPGTRRMVATVASPTPTAHHLYHAGAAGIPAAMELKFQPVYGDNTFSQKHWQNVEPAFETNTSPNVTLSVNALTSVATRQVTGTNESTYARTGFGVPRNSPAVANNIAVGLSTSSDGVSTGSVELQGVAIQYVELTQQRKAR